MQKEDIIARLSVMDEGKMPIARVKALALGCTPKKREPQALALMCMLALAYQAEMNKRLETLRSKTDALHRLVEEAR